MSDRETAFIVALVGVVAWVYVVGLDRLRHPVLLIGLALSVGFLIVSYLALSGDPATLLFAAFNRAFVAAIGVVLGYQRTVHLLAARRRRRRDG